MIKERADAPSVDRAWLREVACVGCEVCLFEGDGSCEPDGHAKDYFERGYDAGRQEERERIRTAVEAMPSSISKGIYRVDMLRKPDILQIIDSLTTGDGETK